MADEETGEYHKSEAGASMTVPMQCGSLKKGMHVCIKGRPCKIVDYSTSKTGKHGHAKANIVVFFAAQWSRRRRFRRLGPPSRQR